MTENRIWATGLLALLLLALFCTWHHARHEMLGTAPAAIPAPVAEPAKAVVPLNDPSLRAEISNGKVRLTGTVPDEASRVTLVTQARAIYGVDAVIDELTVAPTAKPDWFNALLGRFPPDLRNLVNGVAYTQSGKLVIEGDVRDDAMRSAVLASLSRVFDSGIAIEDRLKLAAPVAQPAPEPAKPAGTASAEKSVADATVYFTTGSALLTPKAKLTLRRLVADINQRDATARYHLTGFTDSRGGDSLNQRLSERRAKAVKTYLQKLGMNSDRLSVEAKASAEPQGDNDTVEGRRLNRRVELKLL